MSISADKLYKSLEMFGLDDDEVLVYVHLLKTGMQSALQVSRDIDISRTKVYRIIERLIEKQLAFEVLEGKAKRFRAASPDQLNAIIADKSAEIAQMTKSFEFLSNELGSIMHVPSIRTEVKHFRGIEGLKQLTWNTLKAKSEVLIFENSDMNEFLDFGFAEQVRQEFVERKIHVRELTNMRNLPAWTDVLEFPKHFWKCRYLPETRLKLEMEMLVFDDTYAVYGYKNNDLFGVEIHNPYLANMQRQLFDYMWSGAYKMKIGEGGAARILR